MCMFKSPTPPPPQALPPAPPPPLPPVTTTPPADPVIKDVNPQVRRAQKDRGKKATNQYQDGTGGLRIKLNPKLNTGNTTPTGGLN